MLTAREREITNFVTQGLSNRQIAENLCISLHTVRAYLKRIYYKYGLTEREPATIRVQLVLKLRKDEK